MFNRALTHGIAPKPMEITRCAKNCVLVHPFLYFEVKTGLLAELEIAGVSGTLSWLNSNMAVIEHVNVVPASLPSNGR